MKIENEKLLNLVRKVLAWDIYLTDQCVKRIEKIKVLKQLNVYNGVLEISAHGILWFVGWLAMVWILQNKNLYQMQVNFFIGLILDVIFVAIIKAITRRRRPAKNTDIFGVGPDKYSFPSGHASRVIFIVYFFTRIWTFPLILFPPLFAWSTCVCLCRLTMKRHHILDILAGIFLGLIEGFLIEQIYLNSETSESIIFWLTDEKLDGGEYHV